MACRNGPTLAIAGLCGGVLDKMPIGSLMTRSLTIRTGQNHVQRYMGLLERMQGGYIAPDMIVTHRHALEDAAHGYEMFKNKQDECVKVALRLLCSAS